MSTHPNLRELQLADVHDNPLQPRLETSDEVVAGARAAIEDAGSYPVNMALTVRPRPAGGFEIIAGHHRAKAARELGLATVWAHVEEMNDRAAAIALATTNNQQGMSPLEHARHAILLQTAHGITYNDYARMVGKHPQSVYNYVTAYRVLSEFDGPTGPFADVPVQALTALGGIEDREQRGALLYQFHQRKTSGPQALEVIRRVKEGTKMRDAFLEAETKPKGTSSARTGASVTTTVPAALPSGEAIASRVNQEVAEGLELALAFYQAKAEELEARLGNGLTGTSKADLAEAIARRQRELVAELGRERGKGRTPKQVAQVQAAHREPACSKCFHATPSSLTPTGFRCTANRERDCLPFTQAKCWVDAEEETA